MEASRNFHRSASQIPMARAFVRASLARWGMQGHDRELDDIVLMASELFTNAVIHGAGHVEVQVSLLADRVRVVVSDDGLRDLPGALPRKVDGPDTVTGRGLHIVDRLASAWGAHSRPAGGTEVWLEVARRNANV
ncbi:MAG TPA: ATP-binding protein [Acidimicrobiales bacterium]